MSKSIYEEALEKINIEFNAWERSEKIEVIEIIEESLEQAQKQEQLLVLYKEFFDKLNIQLRNTFDIDYIYPHEFIIGYDIKSEDKELVKLFKEIKELEK